MSILFMLNTLIVNEVPYLVYVKESLWKQYVPVIKHIYNLYNIIILITTVGGEVIFLWNKIMCHTIYSLLSYSKVIHAVQWVTLHNI